MSKFITHLPLDGNFKVTWPYGAIWTGAGTSDNRHHGIDLIGSDNVYSTCEGRVDFVGFDKGGFGNYVKVIDNSGLAHYFAHLAEIRVRVGQSVTYTTLLGIMGATGNVTGKHLHYEIRKNGVHINPTEYMGIPNKEGSYNYLDYKIGINKPEPEKPLEPSYKFHTGQLVVYSSCYRGNNDLPPNYIDCIKSYGAWQQRYIIQIVGGKNPYKLDNGLFVNDGDIREVK